MNFRSKKIFVSYAREDIKHAEELRNFLIGHGHDVFKDLESLDPGEQWQKRTYAEMNRADVIIPVISHISATKQGRIRFEFQQALDLHSSRRTRIIPVRVDGSTEMAGFGNFNVIDWSPQNQAKLINALHTISRRWWKISLVLLSLLLCALVLLVIWRKQFPRNTYRLNFSAMVCEYKSGTPISGVEAMLVSDQGDVLSRSKLSSSRGEVNLTAQLPDNAEAKICFRKNGYVQRCENFELRKRFGKLSTVKSNIRIELVSMQRKCFQLSGFNLTRREIEKIAEDTDFELSYNAPLLLEISFDPSSVVAYGTDDQFIFLQSTLIIYANGKPCFTDIELPAISKPQKRDMLNKRITANLTQTIQHDRQALIAEIENVLINEL